MPNPILAWAQVPQRVITVANLRFVYLLKISSFAVSLIFEVLRRHQVQSLTNKYIP